ncbi:hypothetical protein ACFLXD_05345 [Chloroflexota bacterium]
MSGKMLDLFKALVILIFSIFIIGALIQDAFGIDDAAKKIFLGIGGIGVIIAIYKPGIHRIFFN